MDVHHQEDNYLEKTVKMVKNECDVRCLKLTTYKV